MCTRAGRRPADLRRAVEALGLGPAQVAEIARNAELLTAPAAPAGEIYTGVLYDALDLATLDQTARAWAQESLLIFSGLWGAVRVDDRIPAYRCAIDNTVPPLGPLAGYWRTAAGQGAAGRRADPRPAFQLVREHVEAARRPYRRGTGAARTHGRRHLRTVGGQPLQQGDQGPAGPGTGVAGVRPGSPDELVAALRDLKYTVEAPPRRPGGAMPLDLVVSEL